MQRILRFSLVLITFLSFFRVGSAQTVDTIFGCDDIPNNPLAGAACTICSFDILYGTTTFFTASPDAGWCGSVENDQYIGFVAGPTGAVVFEMSTFNCTNGNGVQVGIYDQSNSLVGDCFNQVFPGTPQVFTAGGLTPGEVYYMRIDGFAGDDCEFNIQVISGLTSIGPDAPGPIMGPTEVCWDESYPYAIAAVPNATSYYWRITFLDPEAYIEAETGAISCTNLEETLWAVTRTGSIPPSTAGDTVSYVWTDWTSTIIGNDESVTVTEPGTYTLTVEMTSDLDPTVVCTETTDITIADNRTAPNPPTLNGLSPVCVNDVPQDYTASGATDNDSSITNSSNTTCIRYAL